MELVEVKNHEIFCDSWMVARKFGIKHATVVRTVERILPKLGDFRVTNGDPNSANFHPKFKTELRHYRSKNYQAYLMNRDFFVLTMMRFDTKSARKWQGQFLAAFNKMESTLLKVKTNKSDIEWTSQRLIGKTARQEEANAIKLFVEYATKQGSESAQFYFKHITNASYKALGFMTQKYPKLRDEMNIYELSQLLLAERLVSVKLIEYIEMNRHYKDIYISIRDDLIAFANAVRLPSRREIAHR